MQARS